MVLAALTLFGFGSLVLAQEMYTCTVDGKKTIQDRPCKGMVIKPLENPDIATKEAIAAGKALCREQAPKAIPWKDPESLRVGEVTGGARINNIKVQVGTQRGRTFYVSVNGKNSYGGYTGEKSLICHTSIDGTQLLSVDSILL